jgi:hypothetical protein
LKPILPRLQILDATLGGFIGLLGLAMYFYPGGTWWDKTTKGHRFLENFLCDLLHRTSLSGQPNAIGSRFAELALFALIVATACMFSLVPEVIPSRRRFGRRLGWFGAISTLLLFSVPLLPSDRYPVAHSLATVFGTLPTLIAFAILVGAILVEPATNPLLRALSLSLLILCVLCAALYTWDVYFGGPSLKALAGLERIATITAVLWLMAIGRFVRLRLLEAVKLLKERAAAVNGR